MSAFCGHPFGAAKPKDGSNIFLAGDFNVHSESWLGSSKTTRAGEYLEELCAAHGLHQHVEMATRGNYPLDLVLSDFGDRVRVEAMSPTGNSDHCVLLASISTRPQQEERTSRQVWRYNQADWGRLRKFFRDANWDTIIHDDPDEACCAVKEKILEGMRQFIPEKRLLARPSDPSWWTPECTSAVYVQNRNHGTDFRSTHQNRTKTCTKLFPLRVLSALQRQKTRNRLGSMPPLNKGQ